ncbi:MAG: DUF3500 domain-containing protein [Chloroflexi bacterium]|nr:DUF3500 domain-containing protein [Chloroflexota bacterium]
MAEASSRFLDSLSPDQKAKATFDYLDGERIFWYYPPMNRHGLALRDMEPGQRELAYAVMASGLTADSYQKAKLIIEHEAVLGPLEKEQGMVTFVRDPELYYFTVFGDPSGADPWGWRVEGHHVSLHFSIWGGKVISMTPFFFGANPAEVRSGPKSGLRILGARQDMALELMNSLDAGQRSKALLYDEAPFDILTYNSSKVSFPGEQGLKAAKMSETQKKMLKTLVAEYVNQVRSDLAEQKLAELEEEGYDRLHWAWAGPAKAGEKHYYRIHGGNFVIEYDNRQNDANHIHSVWRDVENDFASDVMREHLLMYHVL